VELLGRYSNPDNVSRLTSILAGHGRDRPSGRSIRSVQHQTRLNPDQTRELLTHYARGVPIDQLADRFRVNRATVAAIAKRADAPKRYGIVDREIDLATQLYEQGWSTAAIGQHFGVTADTVCRALRKAGITIRKSWERTAQQI
jgi:DNA-directed RNA polymerase specialized sigma24 family protein